MNRDVSQTGVEVLVLVAFVELVVVAFVELVVVAFFEIVVVAFVVGLKLVTVTISSMDTSLSRRFDALTILAHGSCISSNSRQKSNSLDASFCSKKIVLVAVGAGLAACFDSQSSSILDAFPAKTNSFFTSRICFL